jgi:hypothetical protein
MGKLGLARLLWPSGQVATASRYFVDLIEKREGLSGDRKSGAKVSTDDVELLPNAEEMAHI